MHDPKKIARAFLIEGDVDIKMAKLAYINSFYSRSIFFSQQASEKAVKACLVMKGIFSTDHNNASLFRALYCDCIEGFPALLSSVERLEKIGAKARFPLFQRSDLPIWIPSNSFREDEARESLEKGEIVFNRLREFLQFEILAAQDR
ncbi:MAG TPA: HEPN domain-containing protein [Nitrospirota bacterium]|nr:HEPN domain-containing protein [Nitrospirota bacterium]